MLHRQLGKSNLYLPVVSFGAGPISGLMVGQDRLAQLRTVSRAYELGIDYFDTAATYGDGRSERALGRTLQELGIADQVRIATKVRLQPDQLEDVESAVDASFTLSCERLGVERVALLQLHNSVTKRRGDLPTSITARDVLGKGGVAASFLKLHAEGRVGHLGFTGLGDDESLRTVISEGPFASAQIPLNILLACAAGEAGAGSVDVNYLDLARLCAEQGIGVIAIRIMAGGALVGQAASPHTANTPYFSLDVFSHDRARAQRLRQVLPSDLSTAVASIRFVTQTLNATTALIGFATPEQVTAAVSACEQGPLSEELFEQLSNLS